jgi:hypothetical protein
VSEIAVAVVDPSNLDEGDAATACVFARPRFTVSDSGLIERCRASFGSNGRYSFE